MKRLIVPSLLAVAMLAAVVSAQKPAAAPLGSGIDVPAFDTATRPPLIQPKRSIMAGVTLISRPSV